MNLNELKCSKIEPLDVELSSRDKDGNINPFLCDYLHMGSNFSNKIALMFANHQSEPAKYLILVNKRTGERYKVEFPEDWQ